MSAPESGEKGESTEVEPSPVPARGERFGFDLGNPVERESAAFSWLIVVIIAAIAVGATGKLVSPLAAVILVLILLGILSVPIFRGLKHGLGSPDEDE